jgi:signal peptidase I
VRFWPLPAVLSVLVAGVVLLLRRTIAVVTVTGQSMEPTLAAGDRVLVRRVGLRSVRTGQIVVIEAPGRSGTWVGAPPGSDLGRDWMIKRVAAIPGDPVPAGLPAEAAAAARVPDGHLIVFGDNPAMSMDSRYLGYFPGDRVLGIVVAGLPRRG